MSYCAFLDLLNRNTNNQLDYKWLCRFCLEKTTNGIDISRSYNEAYTLLDNYSTITDQCLPISIEYPNFVCSSCERRLSDFAAFIQQIIENGSHWETFLKKKNDEAKFHDIDDSYHESCIQSCSPITKIEDIKIEYCENNIDDVIDANVYDSIDSSTISDESPREVVTQNVSPREVGRDDNVSPKVCNQATQSVVFDNINNRNSERPPKENTTFAQLNTTEFERTCKLCNAPTFPSMRRFYSHQMQQHPGEKSFTCDVCGSQFNRKKRLATHMNDRHAKGGRKHQCQFCAKMFFSDRELKGHELVHLNARSYVCMLCGKSFNQKTALNTHLKSKSHNAEYKTKPRKKIYKYETKKSIRCELCIPAIVFTCIEDRTIHRNTDHRTFECDVCKNTFMAQESLNSHKLIHSDKPRPYMCTVCNASFNQSSHLTGHFKRKHTENKSFQCSHCDKSFFESCELASHANLVHKKRKRVKCDECSSDFATQKYLKVHKLRQHSKDILRYDCKFCGKRLSNGGTLIRHLAKYHP